MEKSYLCWNISGGATPLTKNQKFLGGGYSVKRTLRGHATNMGSNSKNKPLCIWTTSYKMQNLVNIWVGFQNFAQNLAQNWTDWYMHASLFLEKLVFVWVYFQIWQGHEAYQNQTCVPSPRAKISMLCLCLLKFSTLLKKW